LKHLACAGIFLLSTRDSGRELYLAGAEHQIVSTAGGLTRRLTPSASRREYGGRWLRLFAYKDGISDDKADYDDGGDRTDEQRDLGPSAQRRPLLVVVIVDCVEGLGAVFGGPAAGKNRRGLVVRRRRPTRRKGDWPHGLIGGWI
jgi:hypothetical protein